MSIRIIVIVAAAAPLKGDRGFGGLWVAWGAGRGVKRSIVRSVIESVKRPPPTP